MIIDPGTLCFGYDTPYLIRHGILVYPGPILSYPVLVRDGIREALSHPIPIPSLSRPYPMGYIPSRLAQ